jgi:hypothetical protein
MQLHCSPAGIRPHCPSYLRERAEVAGGDQEQLQLKHQGGAGGE